MPVEIEISHVLIHVPVRYGKEDIPDDFPLRKGDTWEAKVQIDTGLIEGWPQGQSGALDMMVCDGGTYTLLSGEKTVAVIAKDYIPNGVIPAVSGDYIGLDIDKSGCITNWPKRPDVGRFFNKEVEDE